MKKVPNESNLIYTINIFILASWCVLLLYGNKLNCHFFGDVNVSVNGNRDILKSTSKLNTLYLRTKGVIILIFYCILLFSICFSSM